MATPGYSAIPTFFDWNKSHATNPTCTGHARYHIVWQVSSYDLIEARKRGLADGLFENGKNTAGALNADDIATLFVPIDG